MSPLNLSVFFLLQYILSTHSDLPLLPCFWWYFIENLKYLAPEDQVFFMTWLVFFFGVLGFLYFACSLLLFGFSMFCFFNKKCSTSDRQQTYSCMFKTAKSSCSPPLALHWSTPWSMHWTPENYPLPIKARLPQTTGVLQPVFVHFKMTFQPVFVSVSLLTVYDDFCVTILFWAASKKKFPLHRASKCDYQTPKCSSWHAASPCKPNLNLDMAPLLPEKTLKD